MYSSRAKKKIISLSILFIIRELFILSIHLWKGTSFARFHVNIYEKPTFLKLSNFKDYRYFFIII